MPNVKLQSLDGELFTVDVQVARVSVTIRNMFENLGMNEGDEIIPLPNVNAAVLHKVIQWAENHKNDHQEGHDEKKEKRTDDISSRDSEFLNVDQEMVFEIIEAANYLDIKKLLDLGCKTVASWIKGKTVEEIRKVFNAKTDSTPVDESQSKKPNA